MANNNNNNNNNKEKSKSHEDVRKNKKSENILDKFAKTFPDTVNENKLHERSMPK